MKTILAFSVLLGACAYFPPTDSNRAQSPIPRLPLILVKGFGPEFAALRIYRSFLQVDGYDPQDLNVLSYPQTAAPQELRAAAQKSLQEIFDRYPKGQKFDLITHSFGSFVGPFALFPLAEGRIRKWVSLAGMTQGQERIPLCEGLGRFFCGFTLPQLVPFKGVLVTDFLHEAGAALRKVDKCALFSPDDGRVNDPPDSAVLPGTVAVEVDKASHNDFIWNRDVYMIMRHVCYGQGLPNRPIDFAWRRK